MVWVPNNPYLHNCRATAVTFSHHIEMKPMMSTPTTHNYIYLLLFHSLPDLIGGVPAMDQPKEFIIIIFNVS